MGEMVHEVDRADACGISVRLSVGLCFGILMWKGVRHECYL